MPVSSTVRRVGRLDSTQVLRTLACAWYSTLFGYSANLLSLHQHSRARETVHQNAAVRRLAAICKKAPCMHYAQCIQGTEL
jgi:hypothetical protein